VEAHEAADRSYMAEGLALLELAGRAVDLYERQPPAERRKLLNFVLSNSTWRDRDLEVAWRQPFDLLAQSIGAVRQNKEPPNAGSGGHSRWLRMVEHLRTTETPDSPLVARVIVPRPPHQKTISNAKIREAEKKKRVVGVLAKAREFEALLREPGVGTRARLACRLGVSRAHVTQTMAVLGVPGRLMNVLVRAEEAGAPVTLAAWRRVKRLPEDAAVRALREMGYGRVGTGTAGT
jgi:hypothetical protein